MKNDFILKLYQLPETVFTVAEVCQLWPDIPTESVRDRLYYFTKAGKLLHLRRGVYAKQGYDRFELANKIYKPSYISLETVLQKTGAIFQYYDTVFCCSYLTRQVKVDKTMIHYRQLDTDILTNTTGLNDETGYFIATPERAFLDAVHIYKNYHFDNLGVFNWKKVMEIKSIYNSKVLEKRIEEYHQLYKNDYGKR